MPAYQVAPYRFTLKPRRSDGADVLPIDDISDEEGDAVSLLDVCAWTLNRAAAAEDPYPSQSDNDVQYGIRDVVVGPRAISFSVVRGTTGIQSTLVKPGEEDFPRDEEHRENIYYRNLLVFPVRGRHAFLLTERIGSGGVAVFLRKLLTDTLRIHMSYLTAKIEPLVTVADLGVVDAYVKAFTFRLPDASDPSGRRESLDGSSGFFSVKWHAHRKRNLKAYTDDSGERLDATKIFGVLASVFSQYGSKVTASGLDAQSIEADVTVSVPGGTRTFTMGQDEGPAIVYLIKTTSSTAAQAQSQDSTGSSGMYPQVTARPTLNEFVATCQVVMTDLVGKYEVVSGTRQLCAIPEVTRAIEAPDEWKAEWHVAPNDALAD